MRNAQVLPDGVTNIQRDETQASRSLRFRAGRWLRSPWMPVVIVLVCYTWWTLAILHAGHDVHDFIHVGRNFAQQSTKSATINAAFGPDYHYDPIVGYDGQFCYFIALDPANARYYIDRPAFRYARILYPMAARLLAFGQSALIPYTLLLLNWLAVGGGTLLVALWLQRRGRPAWLAIVYGLYSGMLIAYQRDLTEPLSYGLVALAIYLFDFGGRRRLVWSGLAFAGALLARETTVVFAGLYGIAPLFSSLTAGDTTAILRGWRDR
ncbi:MAG: AZOBR_p60025 family cell surface glycopolymer formation protein, partial [Ktedonobacterales bacterium]